MTQVRGRLLGAAVAVYGAWCAVQFLVARHMIQRLYAFNQAQYAHGKAFNLEHASTPGFHPIPLIAPTSLPDSLWLRAGLESAVAMALVLILGTALGLGGRGWWALLVALIPAAVVAGSFDDGYSVGQAWSGSITHVQAWLASGVAVDTVFAAVVMALLVRALPRDAASNAAGSTALRAAVPALILVGWWMLANPVEADGARQVWIAQAVVWVVALALIASSSLPVAGKLVVTLLVAPYMSVTMLDDALATPHFTVDGLRFVHHMLVAAAVFGYAAGVPALLKRAQQHGATRDVVPDVATAS